MNTSEHLNGEDETTHDVEETDPLSTETKDPNGGALEKEVKGQAVAPDGGYGWVILFACFWTQFLVAMPMIYGVLYVDLLDTFRRSNADTAWPGSIATGLTLALGPLASVLCMKLGHRNTCMLGGVISSIGLFASSFANDVYILNFTYGVLTGTGMAMAYIPCSVMIGFYFKKRISLANGLAVTGVGLAGMVIPPLTSYLIEVYTWRGCLIIMAGMSLNICVMGALLRPLPVSKGAAKEETNIFSVSLFKEWRLMVFVLTDLLWNLGGLCWVNLIADHGMVNGFGLDASAVLLTMDGVGGVVGKLSVAFLTNHKCCNRLVLYTIAIFVSSIPMFLVSLETSYPALVCYCVLYGLCFGVQLGLLPVIVLELFGLKRLTSAYGYAMLGDGIGAFIGPPLGGLIFDFTKSYTMSFLFGGVCCVGSAILSLVLVLSARCGGAHPEEIEMEQAEEEKVDTV